MSTHDYVIANASGSSVRSDINNALAAIVSNNSSSSEPSTKYAYMLWADTTNNLIKLRNSANNAWITLFTTAGGLDVDAASNFNEDVTFTGASANVTWDKSTDDLIFNDNAKAVFGTSSDGLEIYHNSNDSYIVDTGTGDLKIRSTSGIQLQNGSTNYLTCAPSSGVDLYFDGDRKLKTLSTGAEVESTTGNTNFIVHAEHDNSSSYASIKAYTENNQAPCYLMFGDADDSFVGGFKYENNNDQLIMYTNNSAQWYINSDGHFRNNSDTRKIQVGAGEDLEIYHNGSNGWVDMITGNLYLKTAGSKGVYILDDNDDTLLSAIDDGGVTLTWNNSPKFATSSTGASLTGNLVNSGIVVASSGLTQVDNSQSLISQSSTGSATTTYYIGNQSITTSSDQRLKENIVNTELNAITELNKVRVVDFTWNDPSDNSVNNRNARGKWTGCLAQEMVDIFPHAVNAPRPEGKEIDNDSEDIWGMEYQHLVPVLIKAIQELSAKVAALEAK